MLFAWANGIEEKGLISIKQVSIINDNTNKNIIPKNKIQQILKVFRPTNAQKK